MRQAKRERCDAREKERERELETRSLARGQGDAWIIRSSLSVDIAQLKSTSAIAHVSTIVCGGRGEPDADTASGFRTCPKRNSLIFKHSPTAFTPTVYGHFELIVSRVYFRIQIQSYVRLPTAVHRVNEKPHFCFLIVRRNSDRPELPYRPTFYFMADEILFCIITDSHSSRKNAVSWS